MGRKWSLVQRYTVTIAGLAIVVTTGAAPAMAQPYEAHTDVEFRLGGD